MHRDKFPERIPFRLTRMLTTAMEVCGIEGTFRFTCENVMRVMRHDKGSVMAMLEAVSMYVCVYVYIYIYVCVCVCVCV
jgi:FKBP12-rapamycin complex-associated protein